MGSSISVSKCRDKYPFLNKQCPECEECESKTCPACEKCESRTCPVWTQEECSNKYPVSQSNEYIKLKDQVASLTSLTQKHMSSNVKCQSDLIEKQNIIDKYKKDLEASVKKNFETVQELIQCRIKP